MAATTLPIDTKIYDTLPISVFVCELTGEESGSPADGRIVYANPAFREYWETWCRKGEPAGAGLIKAGFLDEHSFSLLVSQARQEKGSFSAYLPLINRHLHFQQMKEVSLPFAGFFLTDISAREKEEAQLHFLQHIASLKNNAVLLQCHEDGRREAVYLSEDFAQMMECTVQEALQLVNGEGFLETTLPEDRPQVIAMLNRRVGEDGSHTLTIRKQTAKKNIIWCNVYYTFIEHGSISYIYTTYSNITVIKTYEERLRSVYANLGSNFYHANERTLALLRVNLSKNLIEEVKTLELFDQDVTKEPYSAVMNQRAAYFILPEEKQRFLSIFDKDSLCDRYLEGSVSESGLFFAKTSKGCYCYINVTATLTRHPISGDVIAFISEQECNDDKVKETLLTTILSKQFDMVAYLVNDNYGVSIGDAKRIRQGNIFPATEKGSYQEYLERQVLPVLDADASDRKKMMEALSLKTIEEKTKEQGTYVVDISIVIDEVKYNKRFDFYAIDPQAAFYVVLKSDTTALNREQAMINEQLSTALEEAKQANIAKTAFLSSMSHEIRTPMNAIIGIDNIALKDENLSEQTKEYFEKIGVSARHLLSLINDILDMSRIESGRMVLKNEEFQFRGFLEQINTLVASQCQDKGLLYDCRLKGTFSEYYIGDDMKLKQVLINILGNAVKFTKPSGRVTLLVEQVAQYEEQSTLRFVIQDTGIGMDEEYLPKIFDAFSQEDATTTNAYGGSGLGMAITKNIVEMMNGNINVASKKGEGTTFTVNVTMRCSDRKDSERTVSIRPEDLKVLIIDDDEVASENAKLVLEEVGIVSDMTGSGEEALEMMRVRSARQDPYNLILMDLKMPGHDGIEMTRCIRSIYKEEVAIVLLTAYSYVEIEDKALAAGIDSFMSKPLFASNVLYDFQQILSRKQIRSDEKQKKAELKGRRILLAEDIQINAEIITMMLEMSEMQVEHALNGKIALSLFTEHPQGYYDAILMDMRMPVMDGLEATVAIRKSGHPDGMRIPIIALTANAFDEDVQRSLQAGMDAHLSKPVEPEILNTTISGLIGSRE